jgi:hypothetical protein
VSDGWLGYSEESECDWHGCTCNATDGGPLYLSGRVSAPAFELALLGGSLWGLALDLNDLSGPIPTEIRLLSSLEGAAMNYNRFSGTIPTDLGQLGRLTGLSILGVASLAGPILSDLGKHVEPRLLGAGGERPVGKPSVGARQALEPAGPVLVQEPKG